MKIHLSYAQAKTTPFGVPWLKRNILLLLLTSSLKGLHDKLIVFRQKMPSGSNVAIARDMLKFTTHAPFLPFYFFTFIIYFFLITLVSPLYFLFPPLLSAILFFSFVPLNVFSSQKKWLWLIFFHSTLGRGRDSWLDWCFEGLYWCIFIKAAMTVMF